MIHLVEIKIRVDSVSIVGEGKKKEETKMKIAMNWASQFQQQHISYDAKCFFSFFLSIIHIIKKKKKNKE